MNKVTIEQAEKLVETYVKSVRHRGGSVVAGLKTLLSMALAGYSSPDPVKFIENQIVWENDGSIIPVENIADLLD